jgi:succinate dehydrogenase / fumarate reductase flavoprotein subunit
MKKPKAIVVGGGLAGLMTVIKLAEAGYAVELFSIIRSRRSHSVCAQGGINASKNTKGEGDSPEVHFQETIVGGDFLANQPLAKEMCYAAPAIVDLLDRMGVMFNRTPEGHLDFRGFGGTLFHRTAFAGATTGQQMLYAQDEQVRHYEAEGLVTRHETSEFLSLVLDENQVCRGITALELTDGRIGAFRGDAVAICTGGPGYIFGKSTNSFINTGAAASRCYQQGVLYANGEFIQVHPTAVPGTDKLRLISESARSEGGRVWTWKDGKKWYFLEEWYPKYGNLVPRDIGSRAIHKVCVEMGLGVDGKNQVYLDLTHIPRETLELKLGGILEIYRKFMNEDPCEVPMKVFPAVHYSMGGLWIDNDHQTNVAGCFAMGEVDYQYHGANRLGANSLLSCFYGGMKGGPAMVRYCKALDKLAEDVPSALYESERKRQEEVFSGILKMNGKENPWRLHRELGEWMLNNMTIVRENKRLRETDQKLSELMERWRNVGVGDTGRYMNQSVAFTRQLWDMLILARVMVRGAILRNESRGAHYKPEFPERDDQNWLKTTLARYTAEGPEISYEPVDISLLAPRARRYDK